MSNKIIISQIGSRHRYLIPRVLDRAGVLYRLYTDSTSISFLGRLATLFQRLGVHTESIARLCNRDPHVPKNKVFSSDILFLKSFIYKLRRKDFVERQCLIFDGLSDRCIKWGIGDADCIYGMYFENFRFLQFAKSKGLKVVVDIYERPMTYKLLIDEIKNNEEYNVFLPLIPNYEKKHEIRIRYIDALLDLADFYTIPSKAVKRSLESFRSYSEKKAIIIPYASSITTTSYRWRPIKHRLLFVGSDPVNKGLLYCAKALVLLKEKYPDIDFRIAGSGFESIKEISPFDGLHFIGFLSKKELLDEYCTCEALVFPTLYEGFAGSILEAASCGCPIITTENSGIDASSFPGIVIVEKNFYSIVDAVSLLFENHDMQKQMSQALFKYATNLSPDAYEKRLVSFLGSI